MKRAGPMRRLTPLRRKRWPQRRPPRRLRTGDPIYLALVRRLPCTARDISRCSGPMEAHHAGRRGISQKSSDRETVAMCRTHHRHLTDHTGPFKGWSRAQRRLWSDANILATKMLVRALQRLGEQLFVEPMAAAMAAKGAR